MKRFVITFGHDQKDNDQKDLTNCYTFIFANNKNEARDVATEKFGETWSNLYTSEAAAGVHRFGLKYLKYVNL